MTTEETTDLLSELLGLLDLLLLVSHDLNNGLLGLLVGLSLGLLVGLLHRALLAESLALGLLLSVLDQSASLAADLASVATDETTEDTLLAVLVLLDQLLELVQLGLLVRLLGGLLGLLVTSLLVISLLGEEDLRVGRGAGADGGLADSSALVTALGESATSLAQLALVLAEEVAELQVGLNLLVVEGEHTANLLVLLVGIETLLGNTANLLANLLQREFGIGGRRAANGQVAQSVALHGGIVGTGRAQMGLNYWMVIGIPD